MNRVKKLNQEYRYSYDAFGNLLSMKDLRSSGLSTDYTYDTIGRLVRFTRADGFGGNMSYDPYGRVDFTKYTVSGTPRLTEYEYDSFNRVTEVKLPKNSRNITYEYDELNRLGKKSLSLATPLEYTYGYSAGVNGASSRVWMLKAGNKTYQYTYDALGNITGVTLGGKTAHYTYNGRNMLTEDKDEINGRWYMYSYNDQGNISSKLIMGYALGTDGIWRSWPLQDSPGTITYEYNNPNWPDQLTKYGNYNISYDAIGNPTSYRDGITMQWQNGREMYSFLKKRSDNSIDMSVTSQYDSNGQRTQKTSYGSLNPSPATTTYYYDGTRLVYEKRDRSSGSDENIWYYYDASGDVVGFELNNVEYYYVKNLQGDVVQIVDKNNTVVVEYTYEPFGGLASMTGSLKDTVGVANPIRYRSYYFDDDMGFYYLNSRYYDPVTGRFINADGMLSTGQGINGYNMYTYCLNNPVNLYDPTGDDSTDALRALKAGDEKKARAILRVNVGLGPTAEDWFEAHGVDVMLTSAEIGSKGAIEATKRMAETAERPANIAPGTYAKYITKQLHELDRALVVVDKAFVALSIANIMYETCIGINQNYIEGASLGKIAWDATVDTVIMGTNTAISMGVCTAVGTAVCPVIGTIGGMVVGLVISGATSLLLDEISSQPRAYIKSWVH